MLCSFKSGYCLLLSSTSFKVRIMDLKDFILRPSHVLNFKQSFKLSFVNPEN